MKNIIYPKGAVNSFTVGVTAPSSGLGSDVLRKRFELVANQHRRKGIRVIEGNCLYDNKLFVSGSPIDRSKDFIKMWNDPNINLIHPPWGGEHLIDMLEHIEFPKLKDSPTWVQGFSDISTLLFAITTKTGIATAHGTNFMDFIDGQDRMTSQSRDYLKLSPGDTFIQESSKSWQLNFKRFEDKLDAIFDLSENTYWNVLYGDSADIKGRLIGGCLDTISEICGTPFGDLISFYKLYAKEDGIIIYLENSEQNTIQLYRTLTKFKLAGWFDVAQGVVFGRNNGTEVKGFSYLDCLKKVFDPDVTYPIIYNADIGHKPPQMTIINGSYSHLIVDDGRAICKQQLI
jgi:muramoyltetrapeptide carboxypeptidase LdcA involved in peptidoglycan recycling